MCVDVRGWCWVVFFDDSTLYRGRVITAFMRIMKTGANTFRASALFTRPSPQSTNSHKRFVFTILVMCIRVCLRVHLSVKVPAEFRQRGWISWRWSYSCELFNMGAGNQLRSPAEAVPALNHWAISPLPHFTFKWTMHNIRGPHCRNLAYFKTGIILLILVNILALQNR